LPFDKDFVLREKLYGADDSGVPELVLSIFSCTLEIPTVSVAFTLTVIVPFTVAFICGDVIETVKDEGGGVVPVFEATTPAQPDSNKLAKLTASTITENKARLTGAPWYCKAFPIFFPSVSGGGPWRLRRKSASCATVVSTHGYVT
jgi:hypothetical protein